MAEITVKELIDELKKYPPSASITFGTNSFGVPLEFYRVKERDEYIVQIELSEEFPPGEYKIKID